jgi:hypothetical protein
LSRDVKNEMNLHLLELEEILNDDQLKEVFNFIKTGQRQLPGGTSPQETPEKRLRLTGRAKRAGDPPRSNLPQQPPTVGARTTNQMTVCNS